MHKQILFIGLSLVLLSCGQKSTVKTDTPPITFAQTYGDGKLLKKSFPILITTDPQETPLPDFGFLFGGLAKMIANVGVAMGVGKTELAFYQQTPELPKEVKEIRLKRVFFYIEPKSNTGRRSNWVNRVFRGKGHVDFDFIKKLILRVKPEMPNMSEICLDEGQGKFSPMFLCKDPTLNHDKVEKYNSYFRNFRDARSADLSKLDEFVVLKYNGTKKEKSNFTMNSLRGDIYMLRTQRPGETSHFFSSRKVYEDLVENMITLDNVILLELKRGPVVREAFEGQLAQDAQFIDTKLGVEEIEKCDEKICLDIKVEEANLLPFLKRLNSNRIDAFIDAGKVPETFQLKGFIEMEVGVDLGF